MRNRFSVRAGAVLALATLAVFGGREASRAQSPGLPVGSKPPSFTAKTLRGAAIDPTKQSGQGGSAGFLGHMVPPAVSPSRPFRRCTTDTGARG